MTNKIQNNSPHDLVLNFSDGTQVTIPSSVLNKHVDNLNTLQSVTSNKVSYTQIQGSFHDGDQYNVTLNTDPNQLLFTDITSNSGNVTISEES